MCKSLVKDVCVGLYVNVILWHCELWQCFRDQRRIIWNNRGAYPERDLIPCGVKDLEALLEQQQLCNEDISSSDYLVLHLDWQAGLLADSGWLGLLHLECFSTSDLWLTPQVNANHDNEWRFCAKCLHKSHPEALWAARRSSQEIQPGDPARKSSQEIQPGDPARRSSHIHICLSDSRSHLEPPLLWSGHCRS